jgi:transposase-like protein
MRKIKRKGAAEWRQLVAEFGESGLTVKDFCEERGINTWTLRDWRRRIEAQEGGFVEVTLPGAGAEYSVVLGNGRELKVSGSFSEKRVRQLIAVLEQC